MASARWYERVFAMSRVPLSFPHYGAEADGYAALLMDPRSGIAIGLHHHDANPGEPFHESRTGLDHISFGVAESADLDTWASWLAELGAAELIEDEDVRAARLLRAQDRAVELFATVEQRRIITPGVREVEASKAIRDLAADMFGVDRHWHKRIVRAGPNTLEPHRQNPPDLSRTFAGTA